MSQSVGGSIGTAGGQDEGRWGLSQMGLRKPQEVSGFIPVLGFREIRVLGKVSNCGRGERLACDP